MQGDRVTLRRLTEANAGSLKELTDSEKVYRYLPTFLYEQKYEDKAFVIRRLYDECLESSLILGVFIGDTFCGLAEIYGYFAPLSKVSVGYRLLEKWYRNAGRDGQVSVRRNRRQGHHGKHHDRKQSVHQRA